MCKDIPIKTITHVHTHAHTCTHTHAVQKAGLMMTFPQLFFFFFFPARQKSITEANLCYPRTPHSTHPIIPNGLSRRRWGLFLDFASNINYRKYLRGYRTTSCSRASDKACWIEVLSGYLFESSLTERANCSIGKTCDLRNCLQGERRKLGTPKVAQRVTACLFI